MKLAVFFTLFLSFQVAFAEGRSCSEMLGAFRVKIFGIEAPIVKNRDPFFTGMADAQKAVEISKQIRRELSGKSPDETIHVPLRSLVPVVNELIAFLDTAQASQPLWKRTPENKRLFAAFKKEAQDRISQSQVTYHWLLLFSMRVSVLSDSQTIGATSIPDTLKSGRWKTHEGADQHVKTAKIRIIENLLNGFANSGVVSLPMTSDLGISAMNMMIANKVTPLAHIIKKATADGTDNFHSYRFWTHDSAHAILFALTDNMFFAYAARYQHLIQRLPEPQRLKAEFMFFLFYHETQYLRNNSVESESSMRSIFEQALNREGLADFLMDAAQDTFFLASPLLHANVNIANRFQVEKWLRDAYEVFAIVHAEALR